jgi:hypothetical protein
MLASRQLTDQLPLVNCIYIFASGLSFIENDTHHINLMDSSEMQSHRYHFFSKID